MRLRTLRMAASREANEVSRLSCSGSGPYSVRARCTPEAEFLTSAATPRMYIGAALDPAGVAAADQARDRVALEWQGADEVPAGQCQHPPGLPDSARGSAPVVGE